MRLLAIKTELRRIMHDPIAKTGAWIKRMLQGHLNYFAVSRDELEAAGANQLVESTSDLLRAVLSMLTE